MRFRGTGKELGCGMLVGIALMIMGIWLLFYGLTYIWYALGSLGAGLFFTLFLGILLRNQRRWEGNQGER